MFWKSLICALFTTVSFITSAVVAQDVPYEPSQPEVVSRMLSMAGVTAEDLVYDLGCGDGRIVITAAKERSARGIGIDSDPERIAESNLNAQKAKVTDKVKFIQQNLFEADIAKADVVTLFLWPEVNLKLRPKLFRELTPGTRIVSHEHTMGTWNPDNTERVDIDGRYHVVYLWILPANVSGVWNFSDLNAPVKGRYRLTIQQYFQKISGTLTRDGISLPIKEIEFKGKSFRMVFEDTVDGQQAVYDLSGQAEGNTIPFALVTTRGTKTEKSSWNAMRDQSTTKPIDQ
jgi:SAM-dependent methyltransferase